MSLQTAACSSSRHFIHAVGQLAPFYLRFGLLQMLSLFSQQLLHYAAGKQVNTKDTMMLSKLKGN